MAVSRQAAPHDTTSWWIEAMASQFLKELPSRNQNNFSHYQVDSGPKSSLKKAAVYLPTSDEADSPDQQGEDFDQTILTLTLLHQSLRRKRRTFCSDTCTSSGTNRTQSA